MSVFESKWMDSARRQIKMVRPDLSDKEVNKYLEKVLEKRKVVPECVLDNNYRHKRINTNLEAIVDWVDATKPVCGGYGVFYKNQHQSVNVVARTIRKFLDTRSSLKNTMKSYSDPECYDYKHYDMLQKGEKVCANAIYGAGGAKVSIFYNLYTAASTTGTAQSLISTTCAAFEAFMENSCRFYDTDECLRFIMNILSEKWRMPMDGIRYRTREEVYERLIATHMHPKRANKEVVWNALQDLTSEQLTRVYYKNNLYEFTMNCQEVIYRLRKIMLETKTFRAPTEKCMKPNPGLKEDLDIIWAYYSEFVHYNHPIYNRIYRLKTSKRRSVLVIDTDSNMVSIYNWINMIMDCFVDERNTQDREECMYTAASTICVFITNMIRDTLAEYCRISNVVKESWPDVNMKNEFFFDWLVTTNVKKNYLSSVLLREGNPMFGKMDIKGLSFIKSVMSENVSAYLKNIVKEDILGARIEYANIIRKLDGLCSAIKDSLHAGHIVFGKPMAVKEPDKYKDPLANMGVRAVMAWNTAYPDNQIDLPENVSVIKVRMDRLKDIEDLKDMEPEIYNRLKSEIFENPNKRIATAGINAIAIPQSVETMPKWIIPFIDVDTIVEDNTKSFFPVLKSLSLEIINTKSDRKSYSNIIRV